MHSLKGMKLDLTREEETWILSKWDFYDSRLDTHRGKWQHRMEWARDLMRRYREIKAAGDYDKDSSAMQALDNYCRV
jgi:hypothetical protein